jgi:hypothetical protein
MLAQSPAWACVRDPDCRRSRVKEASMPGTLKRIRGEMDVQPTPRDKGLTLTLRGTAYDNGMIEVDGVPINAARPARTGQLIRDHRQEI